MCRLPAPCPPLSHPASSLPTCLTIADTLVPLELCGSMALVRLPLECVAASRAAGVGEAAAPASPDAATSADAKWVQDSLHYRCSIECPVKCIDSRLYVRISGALGASQGLEAATRVAGGCPNRGACHPFPTSSSHSLYCVCRPAGLLYCSAHLQRGGRLPAAGSGS